MHPSREREKPELSLHIFVFGLDTRCGSQNGALGRWPSRRKDTARREASLSLRKTTTVLRHPHSIQTHGAQRRTVLWAVFY